MKLGRKQIISIFLLFLFAGSIFVSVGNIFLQPKPEPVETAVIKTSVGTIEIELDRENAPITVENFVTYANDGFYDGLVFHRVFSNFVIQSGGIYPNGTRKITREPIVNEAINGLSNVRGTITMASTLEPDSATSQFFINVVDNTGLDYQNPDSPGYAVFGKVVKGMDVVDAIKDVETTTKEIYIPEWDYSMPAENWPVEDIVIESVTIEDS